MIRTIRIDPTFESWREQARSHLLLRTDPDQLIWSTSKDGFDFGDAQTAPVSGALSLPKEFFYGAQIVSCFRDDSTWHLLYRLAFRIIYEERQLLAISLDDDVREFESRQRLVMRDLHKMKAFVRFKELKTENETWYVAWHRPDHRIYKLAASFFQERFNGMNWSIMTEDGSVSWDQKELSFSPGVSEHEFQLADTTEDLWKTYYSAIFNPARIKISAMKKELPVRHWKTLPETELISQLLDQAPERLEEFYATQVPQIQPSKNLEEMNQALKNCKACAICPKASAPVAGIGPKNAKFMFIGEQPGNEEDLQGKPFVGPAGQLLEHAFLQSGIKREDIYLTNAVKGFKWIEQNSMRLHRTASSSEISTCKAWLKQEIDFINPQVIVCLGRSAAQSILGKMIKLDDYRGKKHILSDNKILYILPPPSFILRIQDEKEQQLELERLIIELAAINNIA